MVELLAIKKLDLMASGFSLYEPDDPYLFQRAVALDKSRERLRGALTQRREELAELRKDKVPVAEITELELVIEETRGAVTHADDEFMKLLDLLPAMSAFETAWEQAWRTMVSERAWPHATTHRRAWRSAMLDCKSETRASFLEKPSGFSRYIGALAEAMDQSRFAGNDTLVGTLVA